MTATTAEQLLGREPIPASKPVSQWGLAWRRLRRHKLAMLGLSVLIVVVLVSVGAPLIAPYDYEEIDLRKPYAPLLPRQ